MWNEISNICYQVWMWLSYEGGAAPAPVPGHCDYYCISLDLV